LKLDALFFAAHPDDAELCAGGTIYKLSKTGKKTGIIDLTLGELGTRGSVSIRKKESINAGKILGISVRENLKIPDGNIENTLKNRIKVISVIRKYRPDIIFLPHFHDRHPDHFHTHELVKEGAFYSGLSKIKTPGLKAHRPGRSFYYMQTYEFTPNVIVDISDAFFIKMRAISCYQTQFYNPDIKAPQTFISDKKFMKFIESRAEFYGFKIGVKYGEPFYTEEHLKIGIENLFEI
jgi:bacillithiol biosynthesis deacetylase BshB1